MTYLGQCLQMASRDDYNNLHNDCHNNLVSRYLGYYNVPCFSVWLFGLVAPYGYGSSKIVLERDNKWTHNQGKTHFEKEIVIRVQSVWFAIFAIVQLFSILQLLYWPSGDWMTNFLLFLTLLFFEKPVVDIFSITVIIWHLSAFYILLCVKWEIAQLVRVPVTILGSYHMTGCWVSIYTTCMHYPAYRLRPNW